MDVSSVKSLNIAELVGAKAKDYAAFFKMRLTSLVAFSALFGYLIAAESVVWMDLVLLTIGGVLVTGSSNGFNQIIEKDLDKLMNRTNKRPLVTGRMSMNEAYLVAGISGFLGIIILWFALNPLAGILGALGLFLYVVIYTPMKQLSPWAVFAGAFPGAIPPMLGYVAYTGNFGLEAGLLFAVQFMWQFPHFWAIAWMADEDYAKAGFRLLPSKGGKDITSAFLILLYSIFLVLVSILPVVFGLVNEIALVVFLIAGYIIVKPSIKLFQEKTDKPATKVMYASFIYIPLVLIAWYIDKII